MRLKSFYRKSRDPDYCAEEELNSVFEIYTQRLEMVESCLSSNFSKAPEIILGAHFEGTFTNTSKYVKMKQMV